MATSFPVSLPTTGTRSIRLRQQSVVAVAISPYTLERQVQRHQGQVWTLEVEYAPLGRAEAEALVAALCSLNGREGTFLFGDSANKAPRGVGIGTPVINGGGQTGEDISTRGWAAGVTGILKAGDWVQIGSGSASRLHKVLADTNSNGSGVSTLTLWPRVRTAWADGSAINTTFPKGVFALTTDGLDWSVDVAHRYGLKFEATSLP